MTKAEIKAELTQLNKNFDGALSGARKRVKEVETTVVQSVGVNDQLDALEAARAGYTDLLNRVGDEVNEPVKTDAPKTEPAKK